MSMNAPDVGRRFSQVPRVAVTARPAGLRGWSLWSQGPRVVAACVVSETAVLGSTALLAVVTEVSAAEWALLGVLAVMGILEAELSRGVERMRRRVSGVAHINMTSVWTFAGVLLLPAVLTALLVVALYWHLAVRSWHRLQRIPVWRVASNATSVIITCYSARAVLTLDADGNADVLSSSALIAVALGVYFIVGALVVLPTRATLVWTWRGLFGGWADNALELATLCLGVLTALTLSSRPELTVLVAPPLLMLHRAVLVTQLEVAATTDSKTGVLNTAGWLDRAERALKRCGQRGQCALLMIDLDFFKRVNDTHGHPAGDRVLQEVASTVAGEIRTRDHLGRFGGEEFVVLLTEVTPADAAAVAERIRRAVSNLQVPVPAGQETVTIRDLSASIGVAMDAHPATGIQSLLDAADSALYRAKHAGRNRVVGAPIPSQASAAT